MLPQSADVTLSRVQAEVWKNIGGEARHLKETYKRLLAFGNSAPAGDGAKFEALVKDVDETDNQVLYGVVRALHLRLHMSELDKVSCAPLWRCVCSV